MQPERLETLADGPMPEKRAEKNGPNEQTAHDDSHGQNTPEASEAHPTYRDFNLDQSAQQQTPVDSFINSRFQTEESDTPYTQNQEPKGIELADPSESQKPQPEQTPGQLAWGKLREALEDYYIIESERRRLESRLLYGHPKTHELRNSRRRLYAAERAAVEAPKRTHEATEEAANNRPELQDAREYLEMVEIEAQLNSREIARLVSESGRLESGGKDIEFIKFLRNKIEGLEVASEGEILGLLPDTINSDLSRDDIAEQLARAIESKNWCLAEKEQKNREIFATKEAVMDQISELPQIVKLRQREQELRLKAQKAQKSHEALHRGVMGEFDQWTEIDARLTAARQSVIQAQAEIDQLAGLVRLPEKPIDPFEWKSPLSLEQINGSGEDYLQNMAA